MSCCFQIAFSFSEKLSKYNLLDFQAPMDVHLFWSGMINIEKLVLLLSPVPPIWSHRVDATQGQVLWSPFGNSG